MDVLFFIDLPSSYPGLVMCEGRGERAEGDYRLLRLTSGCLA